MASATWRLRAFGLIAVAALVVLVIVGPGSTTKSTSKPVQIAVPRNGTIAFGFPATIDGEFVVEVEGLGQQIADLKVEP